MCKTFWLKALTAEPVKDASRVCLFKEEGRSLKHLTSLLKKSQVEKFCFLRERYQIPLVQVLLAPRNSTSTPFQGLQIQSPSLALPFSGRLGPQKPLILPQSSLHNKGTPLLLRVGGHLLQFASLCITDHPDPLVQLVVLEGYKMRFKALPPHCFL